MNVKKFCFIIASVCFVTVIAVICLCKYIGNDTKDLTKSYVKATDFYFESDLLKLEEENAEYTVHGGQPFTIELRNYEDALRYMGKDITYSFEVKDQSNNIISNNNYSLIYPPGGTIGTIPFVSKPVSIPEPDTTDYRSYQIIQITPPVETTYVTVTAISEVPYAKTLTAKFNIHSSEKPRYTITNHENTVSLEIVVESEVPATTTLNWSSDKYDYDNNDSALTNPTNTGTNASSVVGCSSTYTTYKIDFFKKFKGSVAESSGELDTSTANIISLPNPS